MYRLASSAAAVSRRAIPVTQNVRFTSTASTPNTPVRHEYFINVWDRLGADRSAIADLKDIPSSFYFLGEMLDKNGQDVRGNVLSCVCSTEEDAWRLLELTPYYKQGIWDMSTVKISALETVHTSDLVPETER